MHEDSQLLEYHIFRNSSLNLVSLLDEGAEGKIGPYSSNSYKKVAHLKGPQRTAPPPTQLSLYIVEKMDTMLSLEVKNPQVTQIFKSLQYQAVICCFNGFWPCSVDIHPWIYSKWTTKCQIFICSKGFCVVHFDLQEDYQKIFEQGLCLGQASKPASTFLTSFSIGRHWQSTREVYQK